MKMEKNVEDRKKTDVNNKCKKAVQELENLKNNVYLVGVYKPLHKWLVATKHENILGVGKLAEANRKSITW